MTERVEALIASLSRPVASLRRRPGRRKLNLTGKPTRAPRSIQMAYASALAEIMEEARKTTNRVLVPQLRQVARADMRRDGVIDDIDRMTDDLRKSLEPIFSPKLTRRIVESSAARTDAWSYEEINKQLQGMGMFGTVGSASVGDQVGLFVKTNVSLIQSTENEFLDHVEGTILRGVRQGLRHEEIARMLTGTTPFDGSSSEVDKSANRMRFIARDQVSKLNAELAHARHTDAGIEEFEWSTQMDGRERDTHAANDGQIFRYDSPPAETWLPGEESNCRCQALPRLPRSILDRLEVEL